MKATETSAPTYPGEEMHGQWWGKNGCSQTPAGERLKLNPAGLGFGSSLGRANLAENCTRYEYIVGKLFLRDFNFKAYDPVFRYGASPIPKIGIVSGTKS